MKKILFIAQFPPPIHGLSKAVNTLYTSKIKEKYHFSKIDISKNKYILYHLFKLAISKPDIAYFTISQSIYGNWRDLLIQFILNFKHIPTVIHLHGGYYRTLVEKKCGKWQRYLNYKLIKDTAGCIVLGDSLKYNFEGIISNNKIHVVPNCIDNEFLPKLSEIENKIIEFNNNNDLHVLFLSNLILEKGYREVLQIAKLAKENNVQNIKFHFAGKFYDTDEKLYFKSYIQKNNLHDNVKYHGIVMGEEKKKLLHQANVFILLTRYPNEGQPISLLEAMGNGLNIITTNHAGIPDIVKNKINGIVIDKDKISNETILSYLRFILIHKEIWSQICIYNFQYIKKFFNETIYINNMDQVFTSILSNKESINEK